MEDINNQSAYWDSVAQNKTFTHPIDLPLVKSLVPFSAQILDYGCGYGRVTNELFESGFTNIIGVDTSAELVKRGLHSFRQLPLKAIEHPLTIPVAENSVDLVLLFAVITCIPSNQAQKELIKSLRSKLKRGGLIYISDYYLQADKLEVKQYEYLNGDTDNYGVFTLPEGATFRHHTQDWITELLQEFEIVSEKMVEVKTMNGHAAQAFQIIARSGR